MVKKHICKWAVAAMAAICALSISGAEPALQSGDLLLQVSAPSDFADAIRSATAPDSGLQFTHVGIYAVVDGQQLVIEATSASGVVASPLAAFLDRSARVGSCPGVVAMRVSGVDVDLQAAVERARRHIGKPYDWAFELGDDAFYCSELVQDAYLRGDGTPLFGSIPMNFRDSDGRMPQFWTDLYQRLGRDIPQDAPGTNPNSIYADSALVEVGRYF